LVTLEQILGMAVDAAFDDPKLFIQREEIQPELSELLSAAERGDPSDASPKTRAPQTREYASSSASSENSLFASIPSSVKSAGMTTPMPAPAHVPTARSPLASQPKAKQSQPPAPVQPLHPAPTASMVAAARTESITQTAGSSRLSDASPDEPLFSYDSASNAPAFGKKEAPRATRSVSR
jgi:hypothetical protein